MLGGGVAGDLLRVGQRAALHLRQDALWYSGDFRNQWAVAYMNFIRLKICWEDAAIIPSHTELDPQAQGAGLFPEPPSPSGRVA